MSIPVTKTKQATFCGREEELDRLKDAWRDVSEESIPRLITLSGEAGIGKTRLAQEFYAWLAEQCVSEDGRSYWPRRISQNDQNLAVNPKLSDVDSSQVMPFLWWVVRLPDPQGLNQVLNNAAGTYLNTLTPHLQPMYRAQKIKEHLIESGKVVGLTIASFLEPITVSVTLIQWALEAEQFGRGFDGGLPTPQQAEEIDRRDLNARILDDLTRLLNKDNKKTAVPMIWVIDDAQFSTADPGLVELFGDLIRRAQRQNWPLLVIVTHWTQQWHEQVGSEGVANRIKERYVNLNPSWEPLELKPLQDETLAPVLRSSLTGLPPDQAEKILERAGGNPRFLEELRQFCLQNSRFFVDRNLNNPFTPEGLEEVLSKATNLRNLVEARFADLPEPVRRGLALSSLQGYRFLRFLSAWQTTHHVENKEMDEVGDVENALSEANVPYNFVNRASLQLSEFNQRLFHEVASDNLENFVDRDKAILCLMAVLTWVSEEQYDSITDEEQERFAELRIAFFSDVSAAEYPQLIRNALSAHVELVANTLNRYDYHAAYSVAQKLMEGVREERWFLTDLSFEKLRAVQEAFRVMGQPGERLELALAMEDAAESDEQLAVAYERLDDVYRILKPELAITYARKNLELSRKLAKAQPSPASRRGLSVALEKVGELLQDEGLKETRAMYQKSLELRRELMKETGSDQSKREVIGSLTKLIGLSIREDDFDPAFTALEDSQEIFDGLEDRSSIQSLDLAMTLNNIRGNTHLGYSRTPDLAKDKKIHHLDNALTYLEKDREHAEQLHNKLGTPETQRGLAKTHRTMGDVLFEKFHYSLDSSDLISANDHYQENFELREKLYETHPIPQHKWELTSGLVMISRLAYLIDERNLEFSQQNFGYILGTRLEIAEAGTMPRVEVARGLADSYKDLAGCFEDINPSWSYASLQEGLLYAKEWFELDPQRLSQELIEWFQNKLDKFNEIKNGFSES